MKQQVRDRFIYLVITSYLVLALGWILLSDAVLLVFTDPQSLMQFSTVKGIFFVVVSAASFYLALRAVPNTGTAAGISDETRGWQALLLNAVTPTYLSRFRVYALSILLTLIMYWVRLLLPGDVHSHPMLILYMLPIILAAIFGGFGPGIASTSVAVGLLIVPMLMHMKPSELPPQYSLQIAFLLVNGTAISALTGLLREALKRLEINRHILESIVAGSKDAILVKNKEGKYALVNQAAATTIGKPSADIIGKFDFEIFDQDTAARMGRNDAEMYALGQVILKEEIVRTLSGNMAHFSSVIGPLKDDQGNVTGLFGICRDVTKEKAAEKLLQEREQRLSRVIDGSEQGYWEWNIQSGEIEVSTRWMAMLGYTPNALVIDQQMWLDLIHPDDASMVKKAFSDHLNGYSQGVLTEYRIRKVDDSWLWIVTRGKVVEFDELGKPLLMSGTNADITQRKAAEQALREVAVVFDSSHEGILVTNQDRIITKVNQAFTRITGYQPGEVIGQKPKLLASGRQNALFYRELWESLKKNGFWRGELWNRRKSGEIYPELLSISVVKDEEGKIKNYVGFFIDISERKMHEEELERVAKYDKLTGVPNRQLLSDRFTDSVLRSAKQGHTCAVCFLDLDDFRQINECYGNQVGDHLLVGVTANLNKVLRANDTLARLGGDEFVLVLSDISSQKECAWMLERIQSAIAQPVIIGDLVLTITASIGVSLYPEDNVDPDTLLRHADQAMFMAKEAGKNRYQLFDPESDRKAQAQKLIQQQMLEALNNEEFELFYQPKVNLQSKAIIGMEALIRWRHPLKGIISPAEFLPHIQGHDLEVTFGNWVLKTAVNQMASWRLIGLDLQVSVNISARHLLYPGFHDKLMSLLTQYGDILPQRLELEILESAAIEDMEQAIVVVGDCRRLGVRFALDDFGTGYSSLSYLRRLPVDILKIDQSFVRDMLTDPDDMRIVEGVIQLASVFHKEVIAEGVETVAHGNLLERMGCHLAQGYGIAKPMPTEMVAEWCQDWNQRYMMFS
ncbi:EAL domain-containing protein [Leeia sp. TBRC 13508]|uniref:EAL domain-containing protein n=1 Tax=Leeia speluncae TaxID=2884804 RepID=A0ABS8D201_9NEIS|nr:EAL domain-containing protein [Leeia speluncae]MCB6182209.1 EAL domain-containing protein [Leeia speluncae]